MAAMDADKELDLQFRVHAALDVVEEKCSPGLKPTPDSRELYLGMLYSTEQYKMCVRLSLSFFKYVLMRYVLCCSFGYITNTKIKLILVIDSSNTALRENEVRSVSL